MNTSSLTAGVLIFLLGFAVAPHPAAAQETVHQASLSGRVTDPQGAVVPGATVTVRQTETNLKAETVTGNDGRFRFPYLRLGPYELTVQSARVRRRHRDR